MNRSASTSLSSSLVVALTIALLSFGATAVAIRALRPVPKGVITARLVDPDGEPARCNATRWAVREDGGRAMTGDASKRCDEDGRLRWTDRTPGRWRVMAYVEDCTMLDQEVELGAEHGVDLEKIPLQWGGMVVGTVTENGEPAARVEVRSATGRSVVTSPGGQFRLEGVPIGEIELRAARGFSGGGGKTVVTRGGRATLDIALAPVAPRGLVGVAVEAVNGEVVVTKVAAGTPAEGVLQLGDVLMAIDGINLDGDLNKARGLIGGEPDTPVRIALRREGLPLSVALTRVSAQSL